MEDRKKANVIFGCIILLFGFMVLAGAIHAFKLSYDFGPWWPAILIFAGALSAGGKNVAIPFGMISVGALLLARNLGLFAANSPITGVLLMLFAIGVLAIAVSPSKKP